MNAAINRMLAESSGMMGSFLSETASPNLLRVMKAGGLHFAVIDCEHGPFDFAQVAALAAVGNGIGLPVVVRLPFVSREHVQKYLDAGVDGLLLPMTNTAEQAKDLVRFAKYPPMGERGISVTRPHSEYNPGKLSDYLDKANRRVMLFVQIETDEGVQNAAEIAALDGIDALLVGPNDLAVDYGSPGNFYTPEMQKALRIVADAAAAANKPSGIISTNMEFLQECRDMGMRIFSCNSEVGLLHQGVRSIMKEFFT